MKIIELGDLKNIKEVKTKESLEKVNGGGLTVRSTCGCNGLSVTSRRSSCSCNGLSVVRRGGSSC
jgi:hypothetical protein